MEQTLRPTTNGMSRIWISLGLLLFTVVGTSLVVRKASATQLQVVVAAVIVAAATLASAAVNLRATAYPRRPYWTAAFLMTGALLASPWIAGDPQSWVEHARDFVWMFPWSFMALGVSPAQRKGACAATSPWSGWLLVGTGALYAAILLLLTLWRR